MMSIETSPNFIMYPKKPLTAAGGVFISLYNNEWYISCAVQRRGRYFVAAPLIGRIEPNEVPERTACREIYEELCGALTPQEIYAMMTSKTTLLTQIDNELIYVMFCHYNKDVLSKRVCVSRQNIHHTNKSMLETYELLWLKMTDFNRDRTSLEPLGMRLRYDMHKIVSLLTR